VPTATDYASSLLDLDKAATPEERRAAWRQSMAALARTASEEGPGPLEGLNPKALLAGVRSALQSGLVDDLDWLAPAAAGAALYELASALPPGFEQRELGRRVLARLLAADAESFVAIARRMALAGGRGLGSAAMRARIALVTELPIGAGVHDGPLALALASRRDSAREWIGVPSTGSLPSRRLAARLLERAAREVALRAAHGDTHSLRVFGGDSVGPAWQRLLADRESLVWRHLAVARGLLAPWSAALSRGIENGLAPSLTPTEWRRAAASVASMIAVAPERALELAHAALAQGLLDRDPGAASAFVWGLARAAEMEPDAAEQLFDRVLDRAKSDVAEAVLDLRAELGECALVEHAVARALDLATAASKGASDPGAAAVSVEIVRDLRRTGQDEDSVRAHIAEALRALVAGGAKPAFAAARLALSTARASVEALEAVSREEEEREGAAGAMATRTAVAVLRDLDASLLEHDLLGLLLLLGDSSRGGEETLDALRDRLGDWLLAREGKPLAASGGGAVLRSPVLSLRRLRALLHLADCDMGGEGPDSARGVRLRRRCMRISRALLDRFERGPPSPVRRTIVAALARTLDGLVHLGAIDVIDALLIATAQLSDPAEVGTLAEASMNPDLVHVLEHYAVLTAAIHAEPAGALGAYDAFVQEFALDDSARSEALRSVLLRLGGALASIAAAASLRSLASASAGEAEVIATLEASLSSLAHLTIGARARLDPDRARASMPPSARPLSVALARVLSGSDPTLSPAVVASSLDSLLVGVPTGISKLTSAIVLRVVDLPKEGHASLASVPRVAEALPAWLSTRRTIGGFYVIRSLNAGAAGSVFVATRLEEKGDESAVRYALKVPEFSATAARSLSESEFLKMFREEAATLLALPAHPNLARLVVFDDASKPKPILVMELVEGTSFDKLIEAGALDMPRVLAILDGVLSGLVTMHASGVGHLDVKPSNVVLRTEDQPVLVDFGLAGRHIRPGCGTGPYGAPEVWGALGTGRNDSPAKADVYAFACVAFEALTGQLLFDADTEMAQIALHLAHDGFPDALKALAERPVRGGVRLSGLVELLFSALRQDPANRPTAATLRKDLARIAPQIASAAWPLELSV
jgi:hypothetical protein